jgi:hypothetical protein
LLPTSRRKRLTEVTKRNVQSLIGDNTLASVANWADQIFPECDETYNWHFVDIPKDAQGFSDARDCYRPEDTQKQRWAQGKMKPRAKRA